MKRFLSWDCANRTLGWSHVIVDTHIYSKIAIITDDLVDFLKLYMSLPIDPQEFILNLDDDEFKSMLMFYIEALDYFVSQFITFLGAGVDDILEGNKVSETDEITRTRYLRDYLRGHEVSPDTRVIIEHQPNKIGTKTNNKSTVIGYQLAYHYIDNKPVLVEPKLKNTLALARGLDYNTMMDAALERARLSDAAVAADAAASSDATDIATEPPEPPEPVVLFDAKKKRKELKYRVNKAHSKANFLHLIKTFNHEHIIEGIPARDLDDVADSVMQIIAYLSKNNLFV